MDNHIFKRGRKPRQDWNPHWSLKILYGLWSLALAAVKVAITAVATVLMIGIVCSFVFVGILGTYLQDDVLPEAMYNLDNASLDQTSFVYYVDNGGNIQLLQQIHTSSNRQWATIDEIPENLVHAAIAIEDKRFYEHQGVDWITTVKACGNMFFGSSSTFGGSTITQQLIKNLTGDDSVTVQRKVMEIFRAQQFERSYDKDTIMEWYLNTIYLGNGCYGVKSAAAEYFGKELQSLTPAECASLISITNNPSIFNPYGSTFEWDPGDGEGKREMLASERNQIRQINTLYEMHNQEWLTDEEYEQALEQAENMVFKSGIDEADRWAVCSNTSCGYANTASHFGTAETGYTCPVCGRSVSLTSDSSKEVYTYFVDTVLEDVAADLAAMDGIEWSTLSKEIKSNYIFKIQRGGYHIYTTLDMDVQNAVDAIYMDTSKIPDTKSTQQLQSAIVIIDNSTGDIVAMAGGVGEKVDHDGYNRATDAKLQTGSVQKPLSVYAPAFEVGAVTPASVVNDLPVMKINNDVFPKNDGRTYSYAKTVYEGLVKSTNAISVRTLRLIGYDYAYRFTKDKFRIGTVTEEYITSSGQKLSDLGDSPLGLGALTVGATVRDMATAYATFPNDGVYREGRTYTKVYDSEGSLVLNNEQETEQILSKKTVDYIDYCLSGVITSGTGGVAKISGHNVAGKTGTTSSSKDRWFCGYTAYYTAAIWCGYDQPEVIKLKNSSGNPAARLFSQVLTPVHANLAKKALYSTSSFENFSVCLHSGGSATSTCSKDLLARLHGVAAVDSAYAHSDDGPTSSCNKHILVDYCVTGGGVANEYCALMGGQVESLALVKLTPDEIEDIRLASKNGLSAAYSDDRYVYYVSASGSPLDWHGFSGNANNGINAPYIVCTAHSRQAWEAYEEQRWQEQQWQEQQWQEQQWGNQGW